MASALADAVCVSGIESELSFVDSQLLHLMRTAACSLALQLISEKHSFSHHALDQALILACQSGHFFLVQTLVRLGACVNCLDTNGNTPLLICAKCGFTDLARYLLTKKADVTYVNSAGDTALILSICPSGSSELLKVILAQKGIKINHQNRDGYTALMKAVEVMDLGAIIILLSKYTNVYDQLGFSGTVGNVFQWVLIDQTLNRKRETAQDIADRVGFGKLFNLLRVHVSSKQSPLIIAIDTCESDCLNILLDNPNLYTSNLQESINEAYSHIFQKYEHKDINTLSENEMKILKKLLEYQPEVDAWRYNVYVFGRDTLQNGFSM